MRLPFSADQFFDVFVRYNTRTWPAPLVLLALGLAVAAIAVAVPRHSRVVTGALAILWAWMAVAYHLLFFAALTPAAFLFAALFLAEAALLAWHGLHTRRLHLAVPPDAASRVVGGVLVAYALVGYPMVAYVAGQRFPAEPTFGLPCPTVILTFGVLAWSLHPVPWSTLVIPTLWALIGTTAALQLGVVEDIGLPIAALLALGVILRRPARRARPVPPHPIVQIGF
jgi:hypothetical protein